MATTEVRIARTSVKRYLEACARVFGVPHEQMRETCGLHSAARARHAAMAMARFAGHSFAVIAKVFNTRANSVFIAVKAARRRRKSEPVYYRAYLLARIEAER